MNRWFLTTCLLLTAASVSVVPACDEDPASPPPPGQTFANLTQRGHVLTNVELAYNSRRVDWYANALDQDFTFFLATGDVNNGLPAQWGRAEELDITGKLFDPSYPGDTRCKSIAMDLMYENGVTWTPVPVSDPDETWYTTTVYYAFEFYMDRTDITYVSAPGAKARFTVRNGGTEDAPHWQLVELYDLAFSAQAAASTAAATWGGASARSPRTTAGTKPSTWGAIKSLYR